MTPTEYKTAIKGKSVCVLGLGISNLPLIDFLLDAGARVTGRDKKTPEQLGEAYIALTVKGVKTVCGEDYLENITEDIIFKSPGIRYDVPQLSAAAERGAVVTSEMELFFSLCPCPIFAITGSDGKTTTTTLTCLFLKAEYEKAGRSVYLGGNIGRPLIGDVEKMTPNDFAVVELSSFQLHRMTVSAPYAAVTNVTPNHLNWHTDMAEYIRAKENVFLHQMRGGRLVLNYENEITRGFASDAPGEVYFFSSKREPECENAVFERDGMIILRQNRTESAVMPTCDIKLIGRHNVENYMTAIALTSGLVSFDSVDSVAKTFGGVEHRCEFVRELDGVKYYNGSIDSSPTRTIAAVSCFSIPLVVILGGYDKHLDYAPLAKPLFEHARAVVLTGDTAQKVYDVLNVPERPSDFLIIKEPDFEKAVKTAAEVARPGEAVILSPAAASFDHFDNFEQRGRFFKSIVNSL